MANFKGKDLALDQDSQELAIDLTDPNSVAENLDLLSEEQIEELLDKAKNLNKQLKGQLCVKEQEKHAKLNQTDVRNRTVNPFLPRLNNKGHSLVGQNEVVKDFGHYREQKTLVKMTEPR